MRSEMCTIVGNGCWDGNSPAKLPIFMVVEIFVVAEILTVIDCDTTPPVGVVWPSVSIVVGCHIEVVIKR